jgi:CRISPR type III-B/RAMP module-associated protein Cmr3
MHYYTLTPHDLLFFRDGRPIETSGGHGARWPEPSVIFDALHAALWRAFPEETPQPWEHRHDFERSSHRPHKGNTQRFGSLKTAGLFPVWTDGRWLFPAPADVTADPSLSGWQLILQKIRGSTNAPASFLKYFPASHAKPSKETIPPWWSRATWQSYLSGKCPDRAELFQASELFTDEWTTGIGMDPHTQTQDGQRIYSAQYLRLKDNVRCGFCASMPMKRNGKADEVHECIENLFDSTRTIIVGGQQRVCSVEPCNHSCPLPLGKTEGFAQHERKWLVKWILLTPSIWPLIKNENNGFHPGGWLPSWVNHSDGQVKLLDGPGKNAAARRKVPEGNPIGAQLVAACVPKPIPIVGWTERLHLLKDEAHIWQPSGEPGHGPRATHLAVPAGAVYYFEADSEDAARKLAAALNWHGSESNPTTIKNRRSTLMGEKGFGLGVCGTWSFGT